MTKALEDIAKWAEAESPASPGEPGIKVRLLGLIEKFEASSGIELVDQLPTYKNLKGAVVNWAPHIIHFMGHGRVKGKTPELALTDDSGAEDWCSAVDFEKLFLERLPRLIVLQACETAKPSAQAGFMSLAAYLVQRNVPAVVAMQFEIRNDCAIDFAAAFYRALADGLEIDAAVQRGRWNITMQGARRWKARHFGTPVLFMLSPNGIVLPVLTKPRKQQQVASSTTAQRRRIEEITNSLNDAVKQGFPDIAKMYERALATALNEDSQPVGGDVGGVRRDGAAFVFKRSDEERLR
jgi:hypothetical protein